MSQHYTDPKREDETYSLPDLEVWKERISEISCRCGVYEVHESAAVDNDEGYCPSCERSGAEIIPTVRVGWFYWFCFPGCLPDSDAYGPFDSEEVALEQAREHAGVYDEV